MRHQRGHGDMGAGVVLLVLSAGACVVGLALIASGLWLMWYGVGGLIEWWP